MKTEKRNRERKKLIDRYIDRERERERERESCFCSILRVKDLSA